MRAFCRAGLITVLVCVLAACSTLGRPVAQRPLPAPIEPTPPPPFDINSIPDAVPRVEPRSAHGNPPFYTAMGKRYYVLGASDGYVERGVASWYGPTFHGVSTSSGERYDMYAMTAAHKTLPLPTYVRVTNLRNGRTITVRVNDRGPFVGTRLIDLSYTAAAKLDMLRDGTTFVEVRALEPGGTPDNLTRTSETPPPTLYVQAGAFADQGNAERAITRLRAAGLATAFIAPPANDKPLLYRVRIGPINDVAAFDQLSARLATLGFAGARLAMD
ncbi:MAG TPA: septal ring lytic transglycosylase RlpA family protein [Steroidobacteraceae bacterium]|nr:septal ring lytic transglycosylase RlpA family protein [Steroidobacteraceae bacterium]